MAKRGKKDTMPKWMKNLGKMADKFYEAWLTEAMALADNSIETAQDVAIAINPVKSFIRAKSIIDEIEVELFDVVLASYRSSQVPVTAIELRKRLPRGWLTVEMRPCMIEIKASLKQFKDKLRVSVGYATEYSNNVDKLRAFLSAVINPIKGVKLAEEKNTSDKETKNSIIQLYELCQDARSVLIDAVLEKRKSELRLVIDMLEKRCHPETE